MSDDRITTIPREEDSRVLRLYEGLAGLNVFQEDEDWGDLIECVRSLAADLAAAEADRDALMDATWKAREWLGGDTDGDTGWHCKPEDAIRYFLMFVRDMRKEMDEADRLVAAAEPRATEAEQIVRDRDAEIVAWARNVEERQAERDVAVARANTLAEALEAIQALMCRFADRDATYPVVSGVAVAQWASVADAALDATWIETDARDD